MDKDSKPAVLSLGLVRTGTASIATAYGILGYKKVHHGLTASDEDPRYWVKLDHSLDATFSTLPTYKGGDSHLERLFGGYDVITDMGCFFAEELIRKHPDAKVVLTTRDFDKWAQSVGDAILPFQSGIAAWLLRDLIEPVTGGRTWTAGTKLLQGFFRGDSEAACRANLRRTYDGHNELVRRLVPSERLLEYKVGDGWEPLCAFLGKPVPDADFPWVNEAEELKKKIATVQRQLVWGAAKNLGFFAVAAGAAYWAYRVRLS